MFLKKMTNSEQISRAANALAKQGKTPTVALVKTKLNNKVPLPEIISTLKSWQYDPDMSEVHATEIEQESKDNSELTDAITQAIVPLFDEIQALKAQIKSLEEKLTK